MKRLRSCVHINSGILAIKTNEFESVLVRWMNLEPAIQSEVSQKEKHKCSILTNIWNLEKRCWWTSLQGSNREKQREKSCAHSRGNERVKTLRRIETCTPHVKQLASGNLLYDAGRSTHCWVTAWRGRMGWEVGRRFKKEGAYVYLWLIHGDVWQKPT